MDLPSAMGVQALGKGYDIDFDNFRFVRENFALHYVMIYAKAMQIIQSEIFWIDWEEMPSVKRGLKILENNTNFISYANFSSITLNLTSSDYINQVFRLWYSTWLFINLRKSWQTAWSFSNFIVKFLFTDNFLRSFLISRSAQRFSICPN